MTDKGSKALTRLQKLKLMRILISGSFLAAAMTAPFNATVRLIVFLTAYGIAAYPVLRKAAVNIAHGKVFDENFLMTAASLGALGMKAFSEASAVMIFYSIGELFEDYAIGRSRRSITELMSIKPDHATVLRNGIEITADPADVKVGETIVIRPGEKVALDGIIKSGSSSIDTSALTGESIPVDKFSGDEIASGCVNLSGVLNVTTLRPFGESTVTKILDLVENASSQKAPTEKFITKFAKYYTPIIVFAALSLAFIPQIFIPAHPFPEWLRSEWVYRALMFLVVSCPCALVISVPLSFFGGIGAASRNGILIKGSSYLEALSHITTALFDKTGTLTTGKFRVTDVLGADDTLELAAYAEYHSSHPIAQSVKAAVIAKSASYENNIDSEDYSLSIIDRSMDIKKVTGIEEIAGKGVRILLDGHEIHVGNSTLLEDIGIKNIPSDDSSTIVYVAKDGKYHGMILISDQIRDGTSEVISALSAKGITSIMLTGDREAVAENIAKKIGIDKVYCRLLPVDKVSLTENIIKTTKGTVMYTGDGINDAPVLARADIGVAMGGMGSDAAIEAADIVLMDDDISKLKTVIDISKRTVRIAKNNIAFALSVKAAILIISAAGLGNMWLAIFADVGVSIIAILNAMRTLIESKNK